MQCCGSVATFLQGPVRFISPVQNQENVQYHQRVAQKSYIGTGTELQNVYYDANTNNN